MNRSIIKTTILFTVAFTILFSLAGCKEKVPQKKGHWNLVWNDEFNGDSIDRSKWTVIEVAAGWMNREKQAYVDDPKNIRLKDGKLIIEAHINKEATPPITSARLDTFLGGHWTYGRYEVRAKLPQGKGTWPAIFMFANKNINSVMGWPMSGEIDIMEHVGHMPKKIHGTIHCSDYNHPMHTEKQGTTMLETAFDEFHTYGIDWYPDKIDIFVDDIYYYTFPNEMKDYKSWPFYKDFYLILCLAVGGSWGGQEGVDESAFPAKMEIDWVRVYQADWEALGYDMSKYEQE